MSLQELQALVRWGTINDPLLLLLWDLNYSPRGPSTSPRSYNIKSGLRDLRHTNAFSSWLIDWFIDFSRYSNAARSERKHFMSAWNRGQMVQHTPLKPVERSKCRFDSRSRQVDELFKKCFFSSSESTIVQSRQYLPVSPSIMCTLTNSS